MKKALLEKTSIEASNVKKKNNIWYNPIYYSQLPLLKYFLKCICILFILILICSTTNSHRGNERVHCMLYIPVESHTTRWCACLFSFTVNHIPRWVELGKALTGEDRLILSLSIMQHTNPLAHQVLGGFE